MKYKTEAEAREINMAFFAHLDMKADKLKTRKEALLAKRKKEIMYSVLNKKA